MEQQSPKRFKNCHVDSNILLHYFELSRVLNASQKCDRSRVRVLSRVDKLDNTRRGGVVYWMSRDSRVQDNWALIHAQELANELSQPLYVVFCLTAGFLNATKRQFAFLLDGLKEVQKDCRRLNIEFVLLDGSGDLVLTPWVEAHNISAVVCDFNPLRNVLDWVNSVQGQLPDNVYFAQVDAHNVVPCWIASFKQEYTARTFRSKINRVLDQYLKPFPPVLEHKFSATNKNNAVINWEQLLDTRIADKHVSPVEWARAGYCEALLVLADFVKKNLLCYSDKRNDPTVQAQSNLSPWYHFGQISVQRVILFLRSNSDFLPVSLQCKKNVEMYIEECLVRRELADNFCYYNKHYDCIEGAPAWAQQTLHAHASDRRDFCYTREQWDQALTHDPLWNAAQRQLKREGKMHGFMRMYWAKKILEWSASPAEALQHAIFFNDYYSLDGRDSNGYVGCMWSICGVHDQGWKERKVFGKIRYMNYDGCTRKFNVNLYVRKYNKNL
ncbi:dna photolyase [Sucra jujuba nucleopolyhedrovirus]|uniref:Deoxyribodipyrimidine photo-lyase n=1 Tax=Sucra jujuba nucleopolyhedrovirus TaxID=1563660 RepID=A0A097P963_9ABAC|nr:dna photolyase [Sucra jujuba nucleopolyhedrovirus]AIU41370.1 dna photolyase [Sucra jujuba nucleopolyhedrovirus]